MLHSDVSTLELNDFHPTLMKYFVSNASAKNQKARLRYFTLDGVIGIPNVLCNY